MTDERKVKEHEFFRKIREKYVKTSPDVLMDKVQVAATLFSILAGLMFSASILFFSFGRGLLYGGFLAMLTLTDTVLFVFGAMLVYYVAAAIRRGELKDAYEIGSITTAFGFFGFLIMLISVVVMAFYLRWEVGVGMFIVVFLCAAWMFREIKKRRVTFVIAW